MSTSDPFVTVYHSSESSAKALSSTLTDAYTVSCSTAAARAAQHVNGSEKGEKLDTGAGTLLAPAACSPPSMPLQSPTAQARAFFDGAANADEEIDDFGSGKGGGRAGGEDRSGGRGAPASRPSVVDRREVSLADISQMRLEGCRKRQTSMSASLRVNGAIPVKATVVSPPSSVGRARSFFSQPCDLVSAPTGISPPAAAAAWSSVMCPGRSVRRHSSGSSLHVNALDTSMAILEHMAYDTAHRFRPDRSSQSISGGTPTTAALLMAPKTPAPSLSGKQHYVRPANGVASADTQECGNPISFGDSGTGSERLASLLHTGNTRAHNRNSESPSSTTSLSESELRGAHVRPNTTARTAAQQPHSGRLLGGAGAERDAAESVRSSSSPPIFDSGDYTPAQRPLSGLAAPGSPLLPPNVPTDLVDLISNATSSTTGAPRSPQLPYDGSVSNHDFQQIVPLEVKEALRRNMRPLCEDDEDEDDALLPDGLSGRTPPPPSTPPPLSAFAHMPATNLNGYIGSDTPFHARSGSSGPTAAAARYTDIPFGFAPSVVRTNVSLHHMNSAPAVPGSSSPATRPAVAGAVRAGSSYLESGSGDSRGAAPFLFSSIGEVVNTVLGSSGVGVSFQTWRFPSLGKPSPATAFLLKSSLGDEEEEENAEEAAAAAGAATGGAAAANAAAGAAGAAPPLTYSPHHSSPDSARQTVSHASDDNNNHTTRATLPSGSRHDGSIECTVELHSERHTSSRQTPQSAFTPVSPVAIASPGCDTGVCGSSLSSGIDGPQRTVSASGGSPTPSQTGAGHLFHLPILTPISPQSPGSTLSAAVDDGHNRKLHMVYTVYERLLHPRGTGAPAGGSRSLPQSPSMGPSDRNFVQVPLMSASTHADPLAAVIGAAGVVSVTASEAASRGLFSPSMSCSGAMGRSAGYYSFGTRISLSHPNRQTLPHQFVGSISNLHTLMPSPRTAVLGSPMATEVAGGVGNVSGPHDGTSTAATSFAAHAQRRSVNASVLQRIAANPLLQTTLFLGSNMKAIHEGQAWRVQRSAERASVAATATKAAAQQQQPQHQHHQRQQRDDEHEHPHAQGKHQLAPPPQRHDIPIIQSLLQPNAETAAQLRRYIFPVGSANSTVDGTGTVTRCTPGQAEDYTMSVSETVSPEGLLTGEGSAEAATLLTAAMAASLTTAAPVAMAQARSPSTSSSTHRPSVSGMHSSSSSSVGKRTNVSSLSVQRIHDAHEELLRWRSEVHVDPTVPAKRASDITMTAPPVAKTKLDGSAEDSVQTPPAGRVDAAAAAVAEAPREASAAVTPVAEAGGGSPPPRYFRALTEANRLVRHTHGVDGVEREVDNESLDLVVYVGMHLMGWLEVVSLLGCGSFGQVFLCKDLRICDGHFVHPSEIDGEDYEYWNCSHAYLPYSSVDAVPTHRSLVAVKVVKSVPLLEQQSVLEAEMLVLIGAQTAVPSSADAAVPPGQAEPGNVSVSAPPPEDARCANVAKVLADGICYGHHCIVMERYGANLYEYIAANDHLGLPMYQIRSIGAQLFSALSLIHDECHIIHADIKLENVLLTLDSCRGTMRVLDEASTAGAAAVTTTSTATTTDPAAAPASAVAPTSSAKAAPPTREASSANEPPRHQQRRESAGHVSGSPSPAAERSYITLLVGHGAATRQRLGMSGKHRNSNAPLDASSSHMALATYKGQSFCHVRSGSVSNVTVVEHTNLLTPEPRRLQTLNQSAGMLSRAACGASMLSLGGGGGGAAGRSRYLLPPPAPEPRALVVPPPAPAIPHLRVRLIDFSSSCYDAGPFYQYIQSRYYRAPEVIVGSAYNSGIDIWSTGCVLAELLLGMPLLPGCNDHHQLALIEEMIGPLPDAMVTEGNNSKLFYVDAGGDEAAGAKLPHAPPANGAAPAAASSPRPFALRTRENFLEITGCEPQPYRRYFTYQTLQELVRHCPLTLEERRMSNGLQPYVPANESAAIPPDATPSPAVRSEMMKQRFLLFDLLRRLLQTDSKLRPTAAEALKHPFFTSAPPYLKTFGLE